MKPDINRYRKTIRLKEYDYSFTGEYFVTICTHNRECILGEIVHDEIRLNHSGEIVKETWEGISEKYLNVELDEFVIMPNHIHGIIILNDHCRGEVTSPLRKPTLGKIVAYFKYQSTKIINEMNGTPGNHIWQRGYYDRIIRNDKELNNIRDYISDNVLKWSSDTDNPDNIPL